MSDTVEFRLATLNVGNASSGRVTSFISLNRLDAICLQEVSDQDKLIELIDRLPHMRVIRHDKAVGQQATAVVYNSRTLHLKRSHAIGLFKGGPIGPGTGPDDGKPKFLQGGRFIHVPTKRRIEIDTLHLYPGQNWGGPRHNPNQRAKISQSMVADTMNHTSQYTGITFLAGDFNASTDSPTLTHMFGKQSDWTCTHEQRPHQHLPTHGQWDPDHICWRTTRRVEFINHYVVDNLSDHNGLVGVFDIKVRKATKHG